MKKALALICIFSCLLFFVSCDPGTNHIDKDELIANTVRIELHDYENENPKILRINGRKKPKFDFNKATLIATLDESHFDNILNDIAMVDYLLFGTALNEPIGKTLVLYQSNGNMIVLFGCVYTNKNNETYYYGDCYLFDKNGQFIDYLGDCDSDFIDCIETKYFQNNTQTNSN